MAKKLYTEMTEEERYQENLKRLAKLRPIDDILMREMFRDNIPLTQLVLRIITGNNDLIVTEEQTQYDLNQLLGSRSLSLDVFATDSENRLYNIEIQRMDEGASPYRARIHSSAMDVNFLKKRQKFSEMKITYVIFITEHDIFGDGLPLYHFVRQEKKNGKPLGDNTNIMYVNGAYKNAKDKSDLAKLIHDFTCSQAKNMYIDLMADKVRQYKETKKGETGMCRIIEQSIAADLKFAISEGESKAKHQTAIRMLKEGSASIEYIAKMLDLPLKDVKKLAKEHGKNPA